VTLTIASYNIHKGIGSDGRCQPQRILDVLDEIGADAALLQEADTRFGLRTSVLPADLLTERGWTAAACSWGTVPPLHCRRWNRAAP
jgi:endonuclease/exonuclease/phosphatase family metal-dependent hydrolase